MHAFLSEADELRFWEADEKYQLMEFFDRKQYRAADTPLSYRQIHILDSDGMLGGAGQEDEYGWRKFSFKELVFLYLVAELKRFGFGNAQLKELHGAFFKKPTDARDKTRAFAALPLGFVFGGVNVFLSVQADGNVAFCDGIHFPLYVAQEVDQPFVLLNLNQVVKKIFQTFKLKEDRRYRDVLSVYLDLGVADLNSKERELLETIRGGEFESVEVLQRNGEVQTIRKTVRKRGDFTALDLAQVLKAKDYQTVTVHKQAGKIVCYQVEETSR